MNDTHNLSNGDCSLKDTGTTISLSIQALHLILHSPTTMLQYTDHHLLAKVNVNYRCQPIIGPYTK